MRGSRLSRTTEQKTKKQIVLSIVAILVILFVFFQFSPQLLSLISSITGSQNTPDVVNQDKNTLEAPFINSIPSATDSANITIAGTSSYSDAQVELYLNGDLYDTTPLSDDQKFQFENVTLKEGTNIIKARVKKGENDGSYTQSYDVVYGRGDAKLEVSLPSDNQEFKRGDQTINVTGTTDAENTITVNNFRAVVDETGNFSYYLNLNEGDNSLTITATTPSGKKTEKKLTVKYQP